MSKAQKIAFVFGRPFLNAAPLQFMPFALSTLTKLANETDGTIDVFVTQTKITVYEALLPKNVNVIFLDNNFVWSKGNGIKLYALLNLYFRKITSGAKYTIVFGVGQTGIPLAGKLASRCRAKFICLNDEFPDISFLKVWREAEKKYLAAASLVILPDESRVGVLKKQVSFSSATVFGVLPNMPLKESTGQLENIDWRKKLDLPIDARIVVYAGGIDRENNIDFLLTVFPFTLENFFLVMVGKNHKYKNDRYLTHSRIVWIEDPLSDGELHGLVSQAVCTVAFYADFLDLEYVGKSSGKIMRSLLFETPVITTAFESLKFIKDDGMGELIEKPHELVEAIVKIGKDRKTYADNIRKNLHKYTFENYWKDVSPLLYN